MCIDHRPANVWKTVRINTIRQWKYTRHIVLSGNVVHNVCVGHFSCPILSLALLEQALRCLMNVVQQRFIGRIEHVQRCSRWQHVRQTTSGTELPKHHRTTPYRPSSDVVRWRLIRQLNLSDRYSTASHNCYCVGLRGGLNTCFPVV